MILLRMTCYCTIASWHSLCELHLRFLIFFGIDNMFSLVFRSLLRKANEKLSQVLVDVLKTTAAAEETIGLHMQSLRDASGAGQQAAPPHPPSQRVNTQPIRHYTAGKYLKGFDIIWVFIDLFFSQQLVEKPICQ